MLCLLTLFMPGSSFKNVQKLSKNVKKLENSQFLENLAHSGEKFFHKTGKFLINLFLSSMGFSKLLYYRIFYSLKKIH